MRVVLDTNVLLAAFGFRGICRAVVDVCFDAHELVLSEHILGEVAHHLRDKFGHTADEARQRVAILRDHSHIVTPVEVAADVCRDPNDLPVLGTLAVGHADCLVTGDKDLLSLQQFKGYPILSPRQFWQSLK